MYHRHKITLPNSKENELLHFAAVHFPFQNLRNWPVTQNAQKPGIPGYYQANFYRILSKTGQLLIILFRTGTRVGRFNLLSLPQPHI
jgi:hypothetical protein